MDFALLVAAAVIQALDAPTAWGVILGDRDLHARSVGQLLGLLHQTLPKRFFPDHNPAVKVLQGACHDFGRRRRLAVHKDG